MLSIYFKSININNDEKSRVISDVHKIVIVLLLLYRYNNIARGYPTNPIHAFRYKGRFIFSFVFLRLPITSIAYCIYIAYNFYPGFIIYYNLSYQLTGILSVCHGKSLVADLSVLFIVVCVDNHLEGINSRRDSCYRNCWEGVTTEPRGTFQYFI